MFLQSAFAFSPVPFFSSAVKISRKVSSKIHFTVKCICACIDPENPLNQWTAESQKVESNGSNYGSQDSSFSTNVQIEHHERSVETKLYGEAAGFILRLRMLPDSTTYPTILQLRIVLATVAIRNSLLLVDSTVSGLITRACIESASIDPKHGVKWRKRAYPAQSERYQ